MHGGARHAPARLAIDGVERRRIPVRVGGNEALNLHVVEVADWSWWEEQSIDESANPFGAKLWPASLAVADYLAGLPEDVLPAMSVLEKPELTARMFQPCTSSTVRGYIAASPVRFAMPQKYSALVFVTA